MRARAVMIAGLIEVKSFQKNQTMVEIYLYVFYLSMALPFTLSL